MHMETQSNANMTLAIPSATRTGHIHLTINNLDRQISFYTQVLGYTLHWREGTEAALGTMSEVPSC